MAVPCELVKETKQQFVQTYVIKFAEDAAPVAADNWAKSRAIEGAGAYTVVRLLATQEMYLVITLGQGHRFQNWADNMKASIQQMPTHPKWCGSAR